MDPYYVHSAGTEPYLNAIALVVPQGVRFPRMWRHVTGDKSFTWPYMKINIQMNENRNRYIALGFGVKPARRRENSLREDVTTRLLISQANQISLSEENRALLGLIGSRNLDQLNREETQNFLKELATLAARMVERQIFEL